MKQEVLVNIKGIQNVDGENDTTELFTHGTFYRRRGIYYLTYEESESIGYEGCRTTMKIEGPDKISLIRYGPVRSNLIIERGSRNVGYYDTMQGEMLVGVSASDLKVNLNDSGGTMHFKYALDINTSHVSDNEVFVTIRPLEENSVYLQRN